MSCIEMTIAPQHATLRKDITDDIGNVLVPKDTDVLCGIVLIDVYDGLMFAVTVDKSLTPESEYHEVYACDVDLWDENRIADARMNAIRPLIKD